MAKRVNVTLPDDLASALEEFRLSPSRLLQEATRTEVNRRRLLKAGEFDELTVELGSEDQPYDAAFIGRWLVDPDSDMRGDSPHWDAGVYFAVAATAKGNVAVYSAHVNRAGGHLEVFETTLEDIEGEVPENVYRAAVGALGGKVRLDI